MVHTRGWFAPQGTFDQMPRPETGSGLLTSIHMCLNFGHLLLAESHPGSRVGVITSNSYQSPAGEANEGDRRRGAAENCRGPAPSSAMCCVGTWAQRGRPSIFFQEKPYNYIFIWNCSLSKHWQLVNNVLDMVWGKKRKEKKNLRVSWDPVHLLWQGKSSHIFWKVRGFCLSSVRLPSLIIHIPFWDSQLLIQMEGRS